MILIKSLTLNKNSGSTSARMLISSTMYFDCDAKLELPDNFTVTYYDDSVKQGVIIGELGKEYFESIDRDKHYLNITREDEYQDIHYAPIPKYSAVYEDTMVRCSECDQESVYSEYYDDYMYDCFVEDICPKCQVAHDNFPRYETIDQFQERTC